MNRRRVRLTAGAELPEDLAAALLNLATVWTRQASRFTPEAVEAIASATAANSGGEVAFLCRVDPANRRIGDVVVQAVGDLRGVVRPVALVGPDTMLLHSHAWGGLLFPSEDDKHSLAAVPPEIGYAICTPSALALHVVREPGASRPDPAGRPRPDVIPAGGLEGGVIRCEGKTYVFQPAAQVWRKLATPRESIGRVARRLLGR